MHNYKISIHKIDTATKCDILILRKFKFLRICIKKKIILCHNIKF